MTALKTVMLAGSRCFLFQAPSGSTYSFSYRAVYCD